jgi:hypothetical protein
LAERSVDVLADVALALTDRFAHRFAEQLAYGENNRLAILGQCRTRDQRLHGGTDLGKLLVSAFRRSSRGFAHCVGDFVQLVEPRADASFEPFTQAANLCREWLHRTVETADPTMDLGDGGTELCHVALDATDASGDLGKRLTTCTWSGPRRELIDAS